MSAPRYCRSCPPGSPTILSRFNEGDICGACEKRSRDEWIERMRSQFEAEKHEEPTAQMVVRLLAEHGPMTASRLCGLTGRTDVQIRRALNDKMRAGGVELATMRSGVNRYKLTALAEKGRAA